MEAYDAKTILEIFPMLGLLAFFLMWLHIVCAPFRPFLEKYFNFDKFVSATTKIVLVSLILHPLLFLLFLKLLPVPVSIANYVGPDNLYLIWLAVIAWVIFITYDILKNFKKRDFFARHWQTVKLISTLAFFPVLIHSLGLGHNLQVGGLRYVWIFLGITAAIATVYTYFIPKRR